jgi:hypothetical protein
MMAEVALKTTNERMVVVVAALANEVENTLKTTNERHGRSESQAEPKDMVEVEAAGISG